MHKKIEVVIFAIDLYPSKLLISLVPITSLPIVFRDRRIVMSPSLLKVGPIFDVLFLGGLNEKGKIVYR